MFSDICLLVYACYQSVSIHEFLRLKWIAVRLKLLVYLTANTPIRCNPLQAADLLNSPLYRLHGLN